MIMEGNRIFLTSWDDGGIDDIRMVDLLRSYELPGIFFIPNKTQLSMRDIEQIGKYFEVGGHTVNHPADLKRLEMPDLLYELKVNRKWLQLITGQKVDKFCYPRGRYNDMVIGGLKMAGYVSSRTTLVGNTDMPMDSFRSHPTIHVYPNRKEYKGSPWYEVAMGYWKEFLKKDNGYFHIWGHTSELTELKLWGELEKFFKEIKPDLERLN
jgi:peptidoglycan/xylan/chitin deacetylase (PgdA/CDA1 family)